LNDLVSYNDKHNEANGEENRDGSNDNLSWNCGAEGSSEDPAIRKLRERQKRNFLATLLLSQGVPMLLAGDEFGHSQQGNNNGYCQDSEISWINWELTPERRQLHDFVRQLTRLRRDQAVLRRRRFFQGRKIRGADIKDVTWVDPSEKEMTDQGWNAGFVRCLGVLWAGDVIDDVDETGQRIEGDTLLILLNAHHEPIPFQIPSHDHGARWELILDTTLVSTEGRTFAPEEKYNLRERSLAVLRLGREDKEHRPDQSK
jgi:glycogen operon protein